MQKESCNKVSVIVPVYNVEEYLDECVKSIINQTYKNLEIILVDDGSTDSCPKMCDEYAKLDGRIKVIHKENGGQSSARNLALDIASGEYLFFVDSDDLVYSDAVEVLLKTAIERSADIVICGQVCEIENLNKGNSKDVEYSTEKALENLLKEKVFTTSPCARIFKKELFDGIRYQEGRIHEDFGTIYKVIDRANKVVYIDTYKYFYRCNPTSTTNSKFTNKQMDYFYIVDEMLAYMKEKHPKLVGLVLNHKTRNSIAYIRRISASGFSDKETIKTLVKNTRKHYFRYIFSSYSCLSKIYGLLICISPCLALKVFKK